MWIRWHHQLTPHFLLSLLLFKLEKVIRGLRTPPQNWLLSSWGMPQSSLGGGSTPSPTAACSSTYPSLYDPTHKNVRIFICHNHEWMCIPFKEYQRGFRLSITQTITWTNKNIGGNVTCFHFRVPIFIMHDFFYQGD